MQNNESLTEIGEYLGIGGGGLLILRILFWLIPKLKLTSIDLTEKIIEIELVQNTIISDVKQDRETFFEYLEEFGEAVSRIDKLESSFDDRRSEVDSSFEIGDNRFESMSKLSDKLEDRVNSLEGEDRLLNQAISELSKSNAVMVATIKPMKSSIEKLEKNQDKLFDALNGINANLNKLVGKIGI